MEQNEQFLKASIEFMEDFNKYIQFFAARRPTSFGIEANKCSFAIVEQPYKIYIIVDRVETTIKSINKVLESIDRKIQQNGFHQKIPAEAMMLKYSNYALTLDVESFFIFVVRMLEDFVKIIRLIRFPKYPTSVRKLLENPKYREYDSVFYDGLREKLEWYLDFKKQRDLAVHRLRGHHRLENLVDPVLVKDNLNNTEPLIPYVDNTLTNLIDLIGFLNSNLLTQEPFRVRSEHQRQNKQKGERYINSHTTSKHTNMKA